MNINNHDPKYLITKQFYSILILSDFADETLNYSSQNSLLKNLMRQLNHDIDITICLTL